MDTVTLTTGKAALIDVLQSEGVGFVFGIPGATEIQFMDALEQAPEIRYVLGLHEVVCVGMAEGYARATGRPAFLNLHTAPGLAAATPLLYNAMIGGVPLVVTVGQNDTRLLQRDPHLTGDIVGIGKPHAKWSTELVHAADLPTVLHRAFKMSMQPPTGPVLVSVPQNVLAQEFDYRPAAPTPVSPRLRGDADAITRAAAILAAAEKPLILVESGVARCAAVREVVALAEATGARVQQAWMSDVNFPTDHPQYLGDFDPASPAGAEVLRRADVIVGIGCSLFAEAFSPLDPTLYEHASIIHIDDDPWELGKNIPTDCAIQGDIGAVLADLLAALDTTLQPNARVAARQRADLLAAEKAVARAAFVRQAQVNRDASPVTLHRLMQEVKEVVTSQTIVVDECWSASAILRETLQPNVPGSFVRSRQGGSIGEGLPSALGVKLGRPTQDVIAVVGDGSAAWSMQSLWTAARYNIPVTYVITNNATYRQVKLVRKAVLGDYPLNEPHEGMELDRPVIDFAALARSLGVQGERVADPADLNRALSEAVASDEPRVVEVMVEHRA
jgi:benzoylformate decarboxylase